jgi:hypothetical protein
LSFEEKGRDVRSTLNIMPSIVLVTGTCGRKRRGGGEGESESGADSSCVAATMPCEAATGRDALKLPILTCTSTVAALHVMNMWSGRSFLERRRKESEGDEKCYEIVESKVGEGARNQ